MADALSRRYTLLGTMHVSVSEFALFSELYESDPFFSSVLTGVNEGSQHDYTLTNGFLFRGVQLCVPECSLCVRLIEELHSEGHVGHNKTLQLVPPHMFGQHSVGMSSDLLSIAVLVN